VSAKGRDIGAGPYDEFIQTDASINPGNSGGPLLNMKGEVIGINTAIISGNTGGNVGIGFAIPINMAANIMKDLREHGKVTRGWLGVMIQNLTPDLAESFSLKTTHGALVSDVLPNGPAFKGGLQRGDVIVKFSDQVVEDVSELPRLVATVPPGETVNVVILRDGKEQTVRITIDAQSEKEA
jgi:serine protease Do